MATMATMSALRLKPLELKMYEPARLERWEEPARIHQPGELLRSAANSTHTPSRSALPSASRTEVKSEAGAVLLGVRPPPGLAPPSGCPSHGSVLHGTGRCKPCNWFWKAGGCSRGQDCGHCHLCPESEFRLRRKTRATRREALSKNVVWPLVPPPPIPSDSETSAGSTCEMDSNESHTPRSSW